MPMLYFYSIIYIERNQFTMNIEKQLQKDGIYITEKIGTEIVLKITNNISNHL